MPTRRELEAKLAELETSKVMLDRWGLDMIDKLGQLLRKAATDVARIQQIAEEKERLRVRLETLLRGDSQQKETNVASGEETET